MTGTSLACTYVLDPWVLAAGRAALAAAANRSPTICGERGTTWSTGAGLAAVRRARAMPSVTNRTSLVLRTVTRMSWRHKSLGSSAGSRVQALS